MMQEIAASGAGASGASAVHFYLFPPAPIIRHGSEEMKQKFLPKLARGEILMAFGVTEPTAGVDTSRIRTKADKVCGGWLVNGQKVWISNAQNAHKILLLARTSPRNDENTAGRDDALLHRLGPRRDHASVRSRSWAARRSTPTSSSSRTSRFATTRSWVRWAKASDISSTG